MNPWSHLPGGDQVHQGLADLNRGDLSIPALLVLVAASRLRGLQVPVPILSNAPSHPEEALYHALAATQGAATHFVFNALRRDLVSFAEALEAESARAGDV